MKMRFFDFEVFPHWWLCVFADYGDTKDNYKIVHSDMKNARDTLISLLKEDGVCVCGYNIKHYDLIIANAIYQGLQPEEVKIINDIIINPATMYSTKQHLRLSSLAKRKFSTVYQDLMDDNSGSLKEAEANLGLNILESSVPFDKEDLTEEDKAEVITYCKQDVYATMEYYRRIIVYYVNNKENLARTFGIDLPFTYRSTNATLVGKILGANPTKFDDEFNVSISLPSKISEYCYDNLPHDIIYKILNNTTSFEVKLFGNIVTFSNGGIHSVLDEYNTDTEILYIESDDDYVLINVDAMSYYPSTMIQFNILSRAIKDKSKFVNIFNTRIAIKNKPNRTNEDEEFNMAAKLVLNTTFGASGNKYLALYDAYNCSSVCRVGQIFLGAFANKVYNYVPDVKIIQSNTDAVLFYIKRTSIAKLQQLIDEWQNISGINMEIEYVDKIWQKNVNNYMLIENGEVKSRGAWLRTINHRKGGVKVGPLGAFICAKAAQEFLINGTSIVKTITSCKDISQFAITCTKGPTYSGVVHRLANGMEIPLHRANRVYATRDTTYGKLYKLKKYKGNITYTQMPNTPDCCKTINEDLSTYNFDELRKDISYMYYIERTVDLLDGSWKQLIGNNLIEIHKFDII